MFNQKKLNFWRLTFIFTAFTILTLVLLWSGPQEPKAEMMADSMGSMMKQMHLSGITIYDLQRPAEQSDQAGGLSNTVSHHENQQEDLVILNLWTTGVVFLLIPLIIGGSIILAIVWKKQ